jgi:hypothetical protein
VTPGGVATFAGVLAVAATGAVSAQSIRIGDAVRITPTARLHADVRPGGTADDDVDLDLARRRVGVTGRITSHVEFELERELEGAGSWRDAFVDVRANRALQLRAGHFKVPFSREQLTGAGSLDFVDRSRAADLIAPGRSAGVAVHGRVGGRAVGYEVGAFVRDGTRIGLPFPSASEPTLAARVTIRPFRNLETGAAVARTDLDDGRASLRGRLTTKEIFFAPVFVSGRRLRVGGDLDWRPGPLGVRAEFLRADDARQHQGLFDETLPPLRAQGWSVAGVWALAGRKAHARANDGLSVSGFSGLELTVRAEALSFGTGGDTGAQVWTPRAEQLSRATEHAWTAGVNWTVNRLVRVQGNAVREAVATRALNAVPPRARWSPVVRVQVAL